MGLSIDTGKKKKEAEGITPARLKQYLQLAGRNVYRLGANGPGAAKKEWEGKEFAEANPDLYEGGGFLVLKVDYDGADFNVTGVGVIPNASTIELDVGVCKYLNAALKKYTETAAAAAE